MRRRSFLLALAGAPLVLVAAQHAAPVAIRQPWPVPKGQFHVLSSPGTRTPISSGYIAYSKRREFTHAEIEEARKYSSVTIWEVHE